LIFIRKTYTLNALISAPKIPTDFLWALSLFFVVLALVYFVSVFFFRNRLSRLGKLIMAKRKVFSPMICEFLFFEEDGEKKEKINYIDLKIQIRELIKNPFDREVLTAVLLDLRKDVTGKTRTEVFRVYQDLELHKDAYNKLNSWRWELVSKGIFELTQMEVKDSYSLITKFINNKRSTIRKQAEIATVSLKKDGINYFLDHTRYKISEWQQLKLLDVVRNKTDYVPPPFRLWLTSKNNHVVLFALRLIKYYNQNDASASLIQLLRHKDNNIKKEAIFCIRDFNVTDAVPVLKTIFWKCTTDVKMFILEALSQLGTDDDISFLEDIVTNEVAFTVKGKAISALNTIHPEGVLPTQDIVPTADYEADAQVPDAPILSNKKNERYIKKQEEQSNLKDIPVAAEILMNSVKGDTLHSLDIEPTKISFLPIVTEEVAKIVLKLEEEGLKDENVHQNLLGLNVDFEEIYTLSVAEELHFEFLPIVTGEFLSNRTATQLRNELPVWFEEVIVLDKKNMEQNKVEECLANEILVTSEEVIIPSDSVLETTKAVNDAEARLDVPFKEPKISFSDAIIAEAVSHIAVIYDVLTIENDTSSKDSMSEIDWTSAFKIKNIVCKQEASIKYKTENEMEKKLLNIPKPLFYDATELKTTALLETIAQLGDHREIPYLNMLLQQESNAMVKTSIEELIAAFSITDDMSISSEPTISSERQSVFHSLFEVSDTEAKIILLDEIAEVGDEQEIPLLESFVLADDIHLKKTAKKALEKLITRLMITGKTATLEVPTLAEETDRMFSPDIDNLFTVDFELAPVVKEKNTIAYQPRENMDGNTLFDRLCAMSTNLYNKE
jgi:hypothetical protein